MASISYTNNNEAPSSFTPTSPPTPWDVFLSFRGQDTRYTFTDHLYRALHRTGIRTFMDGSELLNEEVILGALDRVIQESKTYIVVLSEYYASSRWCLQELVEVLDCCKQMKRLVVPVFYYIDPSVVRHQKGSVKEAFERHQSRYDVKLVNKWRLALNEVADFSGYHISQNRSQADIIDEIIHRVLLEINPISLDVAKYPVGLDSRVKDLTTLLMNSDIEGVNWIGIHGMGGVGKTTLAKAVYNQNYQLFQGSCFLVNVREASRAEKGIVCLQQQLINDVLRRKNVHIDSVDQGIELIRARICSTKVLIVIDDLDDPKPLQYLQGPFATGSVVIITTRNEDLLDKININAKYQVNHMDKNESRQLFSQHAFGVHKIPDEFLKLSKVILKHAGGNPLALKIFGTTLLNKSEEGWRSFIEKLKRGPLDSVEKNLVISFDALKEVDPNLQDIFLDIACFYIGLEKTRVSRIMETCYTYVSSNIDILTKRCLITIDEFGILRMHDLLRDMGRDIARNNSPHEPGKHSRLRVPEDIDTVLKNHEGTEAIQGIISGYSYLKYRMNRETYVAESFKRMSKLKFLYLNNVNLTGNFKETFKDLRWLHWAFSPLECLPSEFYAEKLVVLEMPDSNMRTIRELNMAPQVFKKLKTLNMSGSWKLETTPDFNTLPCLETLNFEDCSRLEEVNVSIGSLVRLVHLNLENCENLRSLPDSICSLRVLEVLNLKGCSRLEALPTELGHIKSLFQLDLSRNKNLETLPDSICNLRSLEILDTSDCMQLKELPDQLGMITSLRKLNLTDDSLLRMLPDISKLSHIEHLDLNNCDYLLSISELPTNLEWIKAIDCVSLKRVPDLSCLKILKRLNLTNCKALKEIQGLEELTSLNDLSLHNCRSLQRLPNLCNLKHLKSLDLTHCDSLIEIIGLEELTSLEDLKFGYCGNLLSVSKLPPNLKWLDKEGCTSLKSLPNISHLKQLERLDSVKRRRWRGRRRM